MQSVLDLQQRLFDRALMPCSAARLRRDVMNCGDDGEVIVRPDATASVRNDRGCQLDSLSRPLSIERTATILSCGIPMR